MLDSLFNKSSNGIYFGSQGLTFVQQAEGKITSAYYAPYQVQNPESKYGDIFDVFRGQELELVAYCQKALRDSRIDSKLPLVVGFPPKDLIVRFFEMPLIQHSEILSAINFEMKKYIPFKIEELVYDFQFRAQPKSKIVEVVLAGMKQDAFVRYSDLFKQMSLQVAAYEPGLFSLFRLLIQCKKIHEKKSYVLLEFNQDEASLLIIEKGFPYFTRDIRMPSSAAGATAEGNVIRMTNEIRVSVDYYKRQFLKKDVDEIIVISSEDTTELSNHIIKDLGIKQVSIKIEDLLQKKKIESAVPSDMVKAFGAALKNSVKGPVSLNLAKSQIIASQAKSAVSGVDFKKLEETIGFFATQNRESLIQGLVMGGLIVGIAYGMGFSKTFPQEKEYLSVKIDQPPAIAGLDSSSLDALRGSEQQMSEKSREVRELIDGYDNVYQQLFLLAELMVPGVWIGDLTYDSGTNAFMQLHCFSYSPDRKEQTENLNQFVRNLQGHPDFVKRYPYIEMTSFKEVKQADFIFMSFDVVCSQVKQDSAEGGQGYGY